MKHMTTILAILLASYAGAGPEGPLYVKQMPSGLQERFRSFHTDLLGLSRKHASFADFRAKFPPDRTFRRPLVRFEAGQMRIALEIHGPGKDGWKGMRGGPDAVGESILLADGYWLQFNVISKHKALRDDIVSCVSKAFGKRRGRSGTPSIPAKNDKQKAEPDAPGDG